VAEMYVGLPISARSAQGDRRGFVNLSRVQAEKALLQEGCLPPFRFAWVFCAKGTPLDGTDVIADEDMAVVYAYADRGMKTFLSQREAARIVRGALVRPRRHRWLMSKGDPA